VTRKFLTSSGEWTDSIVEAEGFPSKISASEARDRFKLPVQECEFYYSFNEVRRDQYDFASPLRPEAASGTPQAGPEQHF